MKARKPLPRKRAKPRVIHPERSGGHIRERLHGKAREKRREEVFERAGGRCEEMVEGTLAAFPWCPVAVRCPNRATEWSHKRHGARKCDCMDCGIASCTECHRRRHNPKPCPKKVRATA